jgi:2,3-bisphosphoglycerate-independent phosphoglycerate mutase
MSPPPVILCILDGVGWGRRDEGDGVFRAETPTLDALVASGGWVRLQAHGTAVGLPSDDDMGNSEVGHNAMGAGRVFDQGAKLVERALADESIWASEAWSTAMARARAGGTLHLLGLVSDGGVHSHVAHLHALLARATAEGARRIRVHALTDGRDVAPRSALTWLRPLEDALRTSGIDAAVASGGGRMVITMDRYEADWPMVARGWATHVHGAGRRFPSACAAVEALYAEDPGVDDQRLPPFVVGDYAGMADGDAVLLVNFRGDRALEITRAFEEGASFAHFDRGRRPAVSFAGMMQYDGDLQLPRHYLVSPPLIRGTVGEALAAAGRRVLAVSETQKFGHVTYFFNGNRSGALPGEVQQEVPSDRIPFDQAPAMQAGAIVDAAIAALAPGGPEHIRLNLANGDMVGHTGVDTATLAAVAAVDAALGRLVAAARARGAVLLITADHGNADELYQRDKKTGAILRGPDGVPMPSTAHSLNPVPFFLVDPSGRWRLVGQGGAPAGGIARVGATVLRACGVPVPADYLPALIEPA